MIDFSNDFTRFVFYKILSNQSKKVLLAKLEDNFIKLSKIKDNKIFVKTKPQQIIVFISFFEFEQKFKIVGYKFGKTDVLTGTKKRHIETIEQILMEKTATEIENLY